MHFIFYSLHLDGGLKDLEIVGFANYNSKVVNFSSWFEICPYTWTSYLLRLESQSSPTYTPRAAHATL